MSLHLCYGGTFDPIHDGHIAIAQYAQSTFDADIYFIPSADPPHRQKPMANAVQRAAMLKIAMAGHPRFFLDLRELGRNKPSYTIDSLREIRAELGDEVPVAWLIGADAFAQLHTWHEWEKLFDLAHFIVAVRPGYSMHSSYFSINQRICETPNQLRESPAGSVFRLECPLRTESASEIRRAFAAGNPPFGLNPDVQAYIREHGLYPKAL